MNKKYNVVYKGTIKDGFTPKTVSGDFGRAFSISKEQADKFVFNNKPRIIKQKVSRELAAKIAKKIEQIGLEVKIIEAVSINKNIDEKSLIEEEVSKIPKHEKSEVATVFKCGFDNPPIELGLSNIQFVQQRRSPPLLKTKQIEFCNISCIVIETEKILHRWGMNRGTLIGLKLHISVIEKEASRGAKVRNKIAGTWSSSKDIKSLLSFIEMNLKDKVKISGLKEAQELQKIKTISNKYWILNLSTLLFLFALFLFMLEFPQLDFLGYIFFITTVILYITLMYYFDWSRRKVRGLGNSKRYI